MSMDDKFLFGLMSVLFLLHLFQVLALKGLFRRVGHLELFRRLDSRKEGSPGDEPFVVHEALRIPAPQGIGSDYWFRTSRGLIFGSVNAKNWVRFFYGKDPKPIVNDEMTSVLMAHYFRLQVGDPPWPDEQAVAPKGDRP